MKISSGARRADGPVRVRRGAWLLLIGVTCVAWGLARAAAAQRPDARADTAAPRVTSGRNWSSRGAPVLPNDSVDVPLYEVGDHPYVEAVINGRGPFRLALETGATLLWVSPALAEALGHAADTPAGGRFVVDSVRLGAARFDHVTASQIAGTHAGFDGLLGLGVYYDVLTTIDPAHRRVRFTRGALPPANGRDVLALRPNGEHLYDVEIGVNSPWSSVAETTERPSCWPKFPWSPSGVNR